MRAACRVLGGILTSTLRRQCPTLSRLGRDGGACRVLNCDAFLCKVGRTELSQALLGQGRLLRQISGRFGISEWFSVGSHREDIAWSEEDVVPWVVCVFFAKVTE
ncbi:hypothetical protein Taro_052912 [Colocasia esculenta]|uniref:Uncharacterized protein n=1 Tax=Colocasia esculenta TaxID=4460 RepID=A0A843XLA1_COLES|nr:hypothetical protein [Colocasia esculenta]